MFKRTDLQWVVDFDGTIINLDLGAKFDEWLFERNKPKGIAKVLRYVFAPVNVGYRLFGYGQRFRTWSLGQSEEVIVSWIDEFLNEFDSQIQINEQLVQDLRQHPRHLNLLLTGCPEELVTRFLARQNLDLFHDIVGMSMKNSFRILRHPYGRTKLHLVSTSNSFCAIGDSWSDRHLLTKANEAIVVGRANKLVALAQKNNWLVTEPF